MLCSFILPQVTGTRLELDIREQSQENMLQKESEENTQHKDCQENTKHKESQENTQHKESELVRILEESGTLRPNILSTL